MSLRLTRRVSWFDQISQNRLTPMIIWLSFAGIATLGLIFLLIYLCRRCYRRRKVNRQKKDMEVGTNKILSFSESEEMVSVPGLAPSSGVIPGQMTQNRSELTESGDDSMATKGQGDNTVSSNAPSPYLNPSPFSLSLGGVIPPSPPQTRLHPDSFAHHRSGGSNSTQPFPGSDDGASFAGVGVHRVRAAAASAGSLNTSPRPSYHSPANYSLPSPAIRSARSNLQIPDAHTKDDASSISLYSHSSYGSTYNYDTIPYPPPHNPSIPPYPPLPDTMRS
ncbi:hypothetical protein VKT23_013895 [Stygiomarasmius scandens]|uniref:Uncharacterized protein n=1 Tax=Marasmiellus scandens TaxID=2682957 RepID=A0ABR1J255_9AGAR